MKPVMTASTPERRERPRASAEDLKRILSVGSEDGCWISAKFFEEVELTDIGDCEFDCFMRISQVLVRGLYTQKS